MNLEIEDREELVFDVEREITEEDIRKVIVALNIMAEDLSRDIYDYRINPGLFETALMQVADLTVVCPEAFRDFEHKEVFWRIGQEALRTNADDNMWMRFLDNIVELRVLFSEKIEESLVDNCGKIVAKNLGLHKHAKAMTPGVFSNFKMAFPSDFEKMRTDFDMERLFSNIKGVLELFRREKEWESFAILAVDLIILFPEKKKELNLNKEIWLEMKEELESLRDRSMVDFFGMARDLKILAAEKVEVTDRGLEILMPKEKFRQEKKRRPIRKNF